MSSGSQGLRVALLLLVTLAAGAAGGIALDRRMSAPGGDKTPEAGNQPDRDDHGQTTIERFADELGLTEEQRLEIAPILEDTRARMREVFDQVRPAYKSVVDSARARIEAVLTDEQVRMYRELLEKESGDPEG